MVTKIYAHQFGHSPAIDPTQGCFDCSWVNTVRSQHHYINIKVRKKLYEFPEVLGVGTLCNLCSNQLECLSGVEDLLFQEAVL